ncbi:hypothetical protein [Bacillus sp. UNC438CL73TsuS30]|uniref:hypothetical protein n=1 Tax=Bacillus sp. UNC438CL73TsuS30 TaxID=1340434 RepID=UPI000AB529E1|nr:hypothetical protein [Bacillus sp. UNC438CL73TsuS30]
MEKKKKNKSGEKKSAHDKRKDKPKAKHDQKTKEEIQAKGKPVTGKKKSEQKSINKQEI